jgi:hypothetical protein
MKERYIVSYMPFGRRKPSQPKLTPEEHGREIIKLVVPLAIKIATIWGRHLLIQGGKELARRHEASRGHRA